MFDLILVFFSKFNEPNWNNFYFCREIGLHENKRHHIVSAVVLLLRMHWKFVSFDRRTERQADICHRRQYRSRRMSLYNATASQRNAVQQEVANVLPVSSLRNLTERNRTNPNHTVHFVTLISARTPNSFKLGRKSIIHLVAFPKDCNIIRLRRLLI